MLPAWMSPVFVESVVLGVLLGVVSCVLSGVMSPGGPS